MKKFVFAISAVVILAMAIPCFAVETLQQAGVALLSRSGSGARVGYYAGFEVPVVQKESAGFKFNSEVTYLYADKFNEGEVQAICVTAYAEKDLVKTQEYVAGANPLVRDTVDVFRWFFRAGSGTYQFTKSKSTLNPDGDDQSFGSIGVGTGISYKWLSFLANVEVLQVPDSDILVSKFGFRFDF